MSKTKSWKRNKGQAAKQLHETKEGSVKKNKNLKFKNTPMGKVTLINSKAQKNVKCTSSQKNVQKNFADTKKQNQNLQASKNSKQLKHGSPNKKQNFSSKAENKKTTFKPEETFEEQFNDSDNEGTTSQEDVSLNKTDETFEENSDTDTPDIFGKSLGDESDEDDEDFEEEDEDDDSVDDDDDDDDSDEKETVKNKGVKMFEGLRSKAKKNNADKETQKNDDDDDEGKSDENMASDESDNENKEMKEVNSNNKKQNVKNGDQVDASLMETDEDSFYDDDEDEDSDDYDDYDDDDDDDENDSAKENINTLLGNSEDDYTDEDFEKEDEDDDFFSSEDEGDKENAVMQEKAVKAINTKETQMEKKKETISEEEQEELRTLEKKVIIVENIPKETTKGELLKLFNKYGSIERIFLSPVFTLKTIKSTAKETTIRIEETEIKPLSLTATFIYSMEKSALNAVKDMHKKLFNGNWLFVQTLVKFDEPYNADKTVVVWHLPRDVEVNEIYKIFHECGDIDFVEIRNREVRNRTHAFIQFLTKEAVSSARRLCNVVKIRSDWRIVVFDLRVERFGEGDVVYRDDRHKFQEKWCIEKDYLKKMEQRFLHKDTSITNFKRATEEIAVPSAEHKRNIKRKKQQEDNGEKGIAAFQGQKVFLKNKKNKLDKKKKKMAEKLLAKPKI